MGVHGAGAIHSSPAWGKRLTVDFWDDGMSRMIVLVALLVLIVGGMVFLASRVSEQPLTRHEKAVSLDALGK